MIRKAVICLRVVSLGLFLAAVLSCRTPSKAWNGTWKLNVGKSSIPGPNFSIAISPTGEFHIDNGTSIANFRCDGKDYPFSARHSISCIQADSRTLDTTYKTNGVKTESGHLELSPDQKTLTTTSTRLQPSGPDKSEKTVFVRTSGATGFGGAWKNPERLESRPQTMVLTLGEASLRVAFPEKQQYTDFGFDGANGTVHGATPPEGVTTAMSPMDPQRFVITTKSQGRVISQGSLVLSADGKTVIHSYWRAGTPQARAFLIYERQ